MKNAGLENMPDSILFDATSLRADRLTGLERFAADLLEALAERTAGRLHVFCRRSVVDRVRSLAPGAEIHSLLDGARVMRDQVDFGFRAMGVKGPLIAPAFPPPPMLVGRSLMFVHDLVPWVYPRMVSQGTRFYYGPLLRYALPRARGIATTSEQVRQEILQRRWRDPSDVRAVGAGVSPGLLERFDRTPRRELRPPRLLTVGTLEPRKNLDLLAKAADCARREGLWPEGTTVRVVGRLGWGGREAVRGLEWLGPLDDDALAREYRESTLFLYPTLYEGFGLPLLEAMAAGLPAVVSDIPVLREVGGDAPVFADPTDARAWARTVGDLLKDERRRESMARSGKTGAERYSYGETARKILEWIRDLFEDGK